MILINSFAISSISVKNQPQAYFTAATISWAISGGDDGLDNEIISVDLARLNANVEQIFFVLNSYNQIDFDKIPFASIRLYEGTPTKVNKVFASYNIVRDSAFAYKVAMILGKLYKRNGEWKFSAIGEPTSDRKLDELILNSVVKYL